MIDLAVIAIKREDWTVLIVFLVLAVMSVIFHEPEE